MRGRRPAGSQTLAGRLEGVERDAVGAVADRVHGHREAALRGAAHEELAGRRAAAARRRCRPVGVGREHASRCASRACRRGTPSRARPAGGRRRSRCAGSVASSAVEVARPAARRRRAGSAAGRRAAPATARSRGGASKSWTPVTPRACAARWAACDGAPALASRRAPGSGSAQAACSRTMPGRRPVGVALDDAALRRRAAAVEAGRPQRRAVQPQRVVVVGPQRGGALAGHRVERGRGRARASRPSARQPCPRIQPPGPGSAPATRSRGMRRGVEQPSRSSAARRTAQLRKWTCASTSPGTTQRPSRSIRSFETAELIALPRLDASRDAAVAGDRERTHRREGRVEREDPAVLQDHAPEDTAGGRG